MMISILKLKPILTEQNTILEILQFLEGRVSQKNGCLECGIYQNFNDDPTILYLELWQGEEELHSHIQSHIYLHLMNAMDLCREKPEIFYHEVNNSNGLELLKTLRHKEDLEEETKHN